MMKKSYLRLLPFLLLVAGYGRAQDAHFSQFYASSLYLNPALAGIEPDLTLSAGFRSQWRSIVVPYLTNQVSVIAPLRGGKVEETHYGGVGVSLYNDRVGDGNLNTTGVNVSFAYDLLRKRTASALVVAAQGGAVQRSLDLSNTEWGSQFNPFVGYDPAQPVNVSMINPQRTFFDLQAGVLWASNPGRDFVRSPASYYVGAAGSHLNQPDEAMREGFSSRLPVLWKGHAGAEFRISEKFYLSPNALVLYQRGLYQVNSGLYSRYRVVESPFGPFGEADVMFGAWYRYGDAVIVSTGLGTPVYTIGFSYDVNASRLRYQTNGRGAYEITLTIRNFKERSRKRFSTPRI